MEPSSLLLRTQRNLAMLCALALLLLPASSSLVAQDSNGEPGGQVGLMQSEASIRVVLNELPQASAASMAAVSRYQLLRPYGGVSEEVYQARKAQALAAAVALTGVPKSLLVPAPAPDSNGALTPGTIRNIEGINQNCSALAPSDMAVAVSQFFGLQVVNSCITVFNKTTGTFYAGYPKDLATFFGAPGTFVFDPRVIFDWVQRRFVVVAIRADFANSRGFIEIAASVNDDPRGAWNIYHIQGVGAGNCPDFPGMGQNYGPDSGTGAVAISFNVFPCNANGFFGGLSGNRIWFIPKAPIYAGAGFSFSIFSNATWGGVLADSIQPADVQSRSDKPRAIFAVHTFNINFGGGQCSGAGGCNGLGVWAFSNVLPRTGSPGLQWSADLVPTPSNYSLPPSASQPGSPGSVDTNDPRISGTVHYQSGTLWAVTTTNGGAGNPALLAWQLRPTLVDRDPASDPCTGTPVAGWCAVIPTDGVTVEQQLGYDIGSGSFGAYYGTIIPDPERNYTMVFNFSGTNFFPSTAYVSNRATQPYGAWHDSGIFLRNGVALYPFGRWGDYTGVANDVLDPATGSGSTTPGLWFSGMYSRADGTWGTAIGRNGYTQGNQP